MQNRLPNRITRTPDVCHGKAVVRSTRVLVVNVVGAIASGQTQSEILKDYPSITKEDIGACLELERRLASGEFFD